MPGHNFKLLVLGQFYGYRVWKLCLVRRLLGSCLLGFALGLPGAFTLCASLCPTMFLLLHTLRLLRASQSSRPEFEVLLLGRKPKQAEEKVLPALLFPSLFFSLFLYCFLWLLPKLAISVGGGDYGCGWGREKRLVSGNNFAVNLTEIFQLKGNEINSNQIKQNIYLSRAGESLTHTHPHTHTHMCVKRKRHLAAHTKQLPAANA